MKFLWILCLAAPLAFGDALEEWLTEVDEVQALCSLPNASSDPGRVLALEHTLRARIPPAKALTLGDWRRGEIVVYGTGDHAGNCVGCHQLQKSDVAYGTMGPSLVGYGKRSGASPEFLWAILYNPKSFHLCSAMPRFGEQKILSAEEIEDVMAFLLAPASPVNQ